MSTLPRFVQTALNADRKAQIVTMSAIVVHLFAEQKANRIAEELGAALFDAAPHRSLSTWRNYVSVARNLTRHAATLARLESDYAGAANPADAVSPFGQWLYAETQAQGYSLDVNDIGAFAKGTPSKKAKQQAEEAAAAAAAMLAKEAETARAAAAAQTATDNAQAPAPAVVPMPNDGPTAAADENGPLPERATVPAAEPATGYPAAIRSDLLSVFMEGDSMQLIISNQMDNEDLRMLIEKLEFELENRLQAAAAAPEVATA